MAAASPVQGLQEEATCPICLEYFTDPVTTKCGHNFCRSCIKACPEGAGGAALPCPQCRELCPQGELRANRQLQSMVQLVKQLSVQQERPRGEGLCEKHEEKLKLFCEEDEKLICLVCQVSSDHKQHKVCPAEEAAQRYKGELQDCLKALREELGAVQHHKLIEEEESRTLRNKLEAERGKVEGEFKRLHQTLKEQEETLLRRLEEMEKKIISVENGQLAKLSAEMASLRALITEMEKKSDQSAGEFLKDIRHTLNRCEQVAPTPAQMKKHKELVMLDADTTHGCLTLSEGGRRVTRTDGAQQPPDNPKRFTLYPCVLGREGFTSGRHYWELQLIQDNGWHIGVALGSVSRKSTVTEKPEGRVWAVQGHGGNYWALASPRTRLTPRQPPLKLGFYLDCDGGRLSVFNADTLEEQYTFIGAAFTGRVYPYFYLWPSTDLRLL